MTYLEDDNARLVQEHGVLLRHYAELQRQCSAQTRHLLHEIAQLQGQVMRLRAKLIVRASASAWGCEDRCQQWLTVHTAQLETQALERSLRSADWVICQTGCISHDDFWRVQDHCKRTGKTCVLVEQPQVIDQRPVTPNA